MKNFIKKKFVFLVVVAFYIVNAVNVFGGGDVGGWALEYEYYPR
jgi:hypothetical protein